MLGKEMLTSSISELGQTNKTHIKSFAAGVTKLLQNIVQAIKFIRTLLQARSRIPTQ